MSPKRKTKEEAREDIRHCRETRSRAASNVLIVYEYISERELRLIKNLKENIHYLERELKIGENTININENTVVINNHHELQIVIDENKLCAKQKEAWNYLTFSANQNGVYPGVIIEKMCVLLASTLPAKLLYFYKTDVQEANQYQVDMLTSMFDNLARSEAKASSPMELFAKPIQDYITSELRRIKEAFDSVEWEGLLQPTPMVDDPKVPSKPIIKKRIVPESFKSNKTISGVKKIKKKLTGTSNLEKIQLNILYKTIDKAIHNLTNLKISAMNMMEACLIEYNDKNNKSEKLEDVFADPVNVKTYIDNIPAFGQSLQNGINDLKDLKDENPSIFTVEEIKDKICRIKAYMHATLNSYNHQHSVIKFGMGAPDEDYENPKTDKKEDDVHDAMDLVAGMMGIALEDGSGASTSSGRGGRKRRIQKGGVAMNFEIDDNNQTYICKKLYVKSVTKDILYNSNDILEMYKELFKKIDEYKKGEQYFQKKKKFLLAEINICIDRTPYWPELEALYRYDVLDYTFAYARAQYGYNIGIQDEDGLYVSLINDNSNDEKEHHNNENETLNNGSITSLSSPLPTLGSNPPSTDKKNLNGSVIVGSNGGKFRKGRNNQKGGAPLTEEQKLAIDSIARQTGIVDLPTDMIENIVSYLTPYSALMMQLAVKEIPVDVAAIRDAEIEKVIKKLPSHAEIIRLYVYSKDSEWTLKPLPDKLKGDFQNYLKENTSELKTIVSVRFCDAKGKVLKLPNPDPSRYIFKAALDAYVALLGPS